MANRLEQHDDDDLSEILKIALRKDAGSNADLRQRLSAVADELGISPQAVAEAEIEYRKNSEKKRELALFDKERRQALNIHAVTYVVVNIAMAGLNLMTFHEDHEIWFPYILLMWGIGMAIHAFVATMKVDWDNEEFQKWRQKREALGLD